MYNIIHSGMTVLFQGDSVTDCLRIREDEKDLGKGYPNFFANAFYALYPQEDVVFLNRGISGNGSIDLLERYEEDIRQIAPDFISILIGINDTWRKYDSNNPTTVEQFEKNYHLLLTNIKKDLPKTKIMLIDPFLIHSMDEKLVWHEDLDPKIQVVRKLAVAFADYYIPMDAVFARCIVEGYTCQKLADDGVHPTPTGHAIIAKEYLKTLGLLV